jgi:hypothetical protein
MGVDCRRFKGAHQGGATPIEIEIAIEIDFWQPSDFDSDFDFDIDPEFPRLENRIALPVKIIP